MDDELDGILDSALDEFESGDVPESSPKPTTTSAPQNTIHDTSTKTVSQPKAAASGHNGGGVALEDALNALNSLGSGLNTEQSMPHTRAVGSSTSSAPEGPVDLEHALQLLLNSLDGNITGRDSARSGEVRDASTLSGEAGSKRDANDELERMMETVMQQVLSCDLLKEPMEQMRQQYHDLLSDESSDLNEEDRARYQKQSDIISEVVSVYENGSPDFNRVTELLQQMQQHGEPPPHIAEEISRSSASGEPRDAGAVAGEIDELEKLSEQCATQ